MFRNRPMRAARLLTPVLIFSAFASAAPVFVRAQDEAKPADNATYTWTLKQKKGDVSRMKEQTRANISAGGMEAAMEIKSVTKREVKNVAENGDVTAEYTAENVVINFNGQEIDNPEPDRKTILWINKAGVVVKQKIENSQQADSPIAKMAVLTMSTPIPDKPVKIGDTWKTEFDNPLVEGKKVTVTSKLVGKEKIGEVETLAVKMDVSVLPKADATDKDAVKLETTYYVDPQAGRVVRMKNLTDNAEFDVMGTPLKFSSESVSDLVKADASGKNAVKEKKDGS